MFGATFICYTAMRGGIFGTRYYTFVDNHKKCYDNIRKKNYLMFDYISYEVVECKDFSPIKTPIKHHKIWFFPVFIMRDIDFRDDMDF
jgi:hypothetical protein